MHKSEFMYGALMALQQCTTKRTINRTVGFSLVRCGTKYFECIGSLNPERYEIASW